MYKLLATITPLAIACDFGQAVLIKVMILNFSMNALYARKKLEQSMSHTGCYSLSIK
jgi:hypothetical protein